MNSAIKDLVPSGEWKDPERKFLAFRSWKRRFLFGSKDEKINFKCSRLAAPLAQISKKADLSIEDAGCLMDQMSH